MGGEGGNYLFYQILASAYLVGESTADGLRYRGAHIAPPQCTVREITKPLSALPLAVLCILKKRLETVTHVV